MSQRSTQIQSGKTDETVQYLLCSKYNGPTDQRPGEFGSRGYMKEKPPEK